MPDSILAQVAGGHLFRPSRMCLALAPGWSQASKLQYVCKRPCQSQEGTLTSVASAACRKVSEYHTRLLYYLPGQRTLGADTGGLASAALQRRCVAQAFRSHISTYLIRQALPAQLSIERVCCPGKHRFYRGLHKCSRCHHTQSPNAVDLQRVGLWPAAPNLEHMQTCIDERTLRRWHHLKLQMPTCSMEGFAEVLNQQTEAWGNVQVLMVHEECCPAHDYRDGRSACLKVLCASPACCCCRWAGWTGMSCRSATISTATCNM